MTSGPAAVRGSVSNVEHLQAALIGFGLASPRAPKDLSNLSTTAWALASRKLTAASAALLAAAAVIRAAFGWGGEL